MKTKKMSSDSKLFDLSGKVVIVTGAGGLLGQEHCKAIALSGGTPILLDILSSSIEKLCNQLNENYQCDSIAMKIDITDENQVRNSCKEILKKYGKIDALVNNAANNPVITESQHSSSFSRLENFSLEMWNKDLAVTLTGSFLCSKHYGTIISKNTNGGVIINISSDLGLIGPDQRLYSQPGLDIEQQPTKPVSYSVSKSGLLGLTRYIATYWANQNVRSNAICPGGIENNQNVEFISDISSRIPLNRMAKSDEYQSTLVYMLSDSSSYLNGAVISVDGGRTAW
jgi:NAD(P)-dependent dehydrogenase (short-subunit alcohol dehydrogenase family)